MTEYFRITGLNTIPFDSEITGHADHRYRLVRGESPKGIDEPLTKEQAIPHLRNLPTEIASHILGRPGEHVMSVITFPFSIQGADDADMEAAEHALRGTLEDGKLYIATKGARGTRAVVEMKSDEAVNMSYHMIFWSEFTEDAGREILGAAIKESYIRSLQMRLYCEAYWRPEEAVTLGPNEIYCPSFEEDGDANGEADNWDARPGAGHPTLAIETTIVLHGCDSQKITTDAANEGIESTAFAKDAAETDAVAYAWICRPAAGSDIRVIMRDTTNNVDRDTALLSTGGWDEADAKDGVNTFYRLEVSSDSLPAGAANYELWIESTTATATTFYVDKCFWLWGTTTAPDEWADHWLVYNHIDDDEGHQNYFDVSDLKGDVEALTCLKVEDLNIGMEKFALVARRSQGTVANFDYWIEAEAMGATNWATVGDTDRSNNQIVSNAANTTGSISQVISTNLDDYKGRIGIYASVWTDDVVNTQFRFSWQYGLPAIYYDKWKWITHASEWQIVKLGQVILGSHLYPEGDTLASWQIWVEYQKDATDTVKCDYVMLLPEDESAMWVDGAQPWDFEQPSDMVEVDGIRDFPAAYVIASATGDFYAQAGIKGSYLTLQPNDTNRIYFKALKVDGIADPFSEHIDRINNDGAPASRFQVTLDYLPQFISPLE